MKPRLLVLLGCYLPGYRSGGPVRTIAAMVDALSSEFDFYIVTLNHDSGSTEVYPAISPGEWNAVGSAKVFYIPRWTLSSVRDVVEDVNPDLLYLNGFFATSSLIGLAAVRLGMRQDLPILLATRGDLAPGALSLKAFKKRAFMRLANAIGFYRHLWWHVSSGREQAELLDQLKRYGVLDSSVFIAPDLAHGYEKWDSERPAKARGAAKFVTLGRITAMKNLIFTLERLAELSGQVSLDVFGPLEDRALWLECSRKIGSLPTNVTVNYRGPLDPMKIMGELSQRHFFILPTLGENYGHVIVEGAASGCPVIISDQTQWVGLQERHVGWDIDLGNINRWREVLQTCVDMPQAAYSAMSDSAREFGQGVMNSQEAVKANLKMFQTIVACGKKHAEIPLHSGALK